MPTPDDASRGLGKTRIEALADGVFAIAMTLLVFGIKLPEGSPDLAEAVLRRKLLALWPQFLSYAISFVILGVYWVGHHNQFHYIRRTDRVLLWINIFFLLCVALIPCSTSLIGQYPTHQAASVIYGTGLILVGAISYGHWWYATRGHHLVDRDIHPEVVRLAKRRILIGPLAFGLAIGLSFLRVELSLVVYALVPFLYLLPGRIDRHWMK